MILSSSDKVGAFLEDSQRKLLPFRELGSENQRYAESIEFFVGEYQSSFHHLNMNNTLLNILVYEYLSFSFQ